MSEDSPVPQTPYAVALELTRIIALGERKSLETFSTPTDGVNRETSLAKVFTLVAMLLAAVIGGTQSANAWECDRAFYNHGQKPWTFTIGFPGPPPYGADFRGCQYDQRFWICKVAPGHTANIHFTGTKMPSSVTITDASGAQRSFEYDESILRGDCPYVKHSGGTGAVSVNDPADGDFSTDSDGW